jgi:NAD(P)-dependent dehydrogenase (short-subunit alcohol dehydrogenase family)
MFKFEGRTAVISGGAEGIGLSIAKALGEQKMNIVLADIDEKNLLKSTAEFESLGIPVLAALLDVADEMQWKSVAEKAVENDLVRSIWLLIMPVLAVTQDL